MIFWLWEPVIEVAVWRNFGVFDIRFNHWNLLVKVPFLWVILWYRRPLNYERLTILTIPKKLRFNFKGAGG